jgi:phosphoglycerate dehydrogenase-like enzyme
MADKQKIVFLYNAATVPDLIIDRMQAGTPDAFELVLCDQTTSDAARRAAVAEADYLVLYTVGFDDVDVAGKARLMQVLSAGYDKLDVPSLNAAGIPLATNGGANATPVAEHAVMMMLALNKKLVMHHNAMVKGEWLGHREVLQMRELRDKQVGIVGFGKIGQETARMVGGFQARVVYHDAYPAKPEVEKEFNARRVTLEELLETSDVVTMHTPLTPGTRGMINTEALGRMKPIAVLINTSRGPTVAEADLIAALQSGQIAGAGLDVFEEEPLSEGSPLREMDNVILTPHSAGATLDTWQRRLDFAFYNIQRVARGEAAEFTVTE